MIQMKGIFVHLKCAHYKLIHILRDKKIKKQIHNSNLGNRNLIKSIRQHKNTYFS